MLRERQSHDQCRLAADAPSNGHREPALSGRRRESRSLDRLLESLRAGASQVLVLCGTRGVGKSALLEHVVGRATGIRVLRARGVESEMALPYSGLHQVCAPVLELRDRLPAPQRDALASTFGLSAKPIPARLVVGLAVLGLLCEAASAGPLLCVVDDAQWLDSASALALAFVARRVPAESIGFLFAVEERCEPREFSGLPELLVGGLSEPDARELLDSLLRGPLDAAVRDRIVSEARGNPRDLHALADWMASGGFAGGFGVSSLMPPVDRFDPAVTQQFKSLPVETRRLLLVAAAEPLGDPSLLRRAAARLGLAPDAAVPAETAGLIDIAARVRFSHPLLRPFVYREASAPERRDVHRALAEVTDRDRDPDRRAWHRAHATDQVDEKVAAELELCADRAGARGGAAAAAAFLERAAELTPDPVLRGARALAAAEQEVQVGAFEPAVAMLATAGATPLDAVRRARLDLTRGRIALASGSASDACTLLLATARRLEPLDAGLACDAYLDALSSAMLANHRASRLSAFEVARAAREATSAPDKLLEALAVRLTDGYGAAAPLATQELEASSDQGQSVHARLRRIWFRSVLAADLWDEERWDTYSASHVMLARDRGALSELPLALDSRVYLHLFAGELEQAACLVHEAQTVSEATGSDLAFYGAFGLVAWRGREGEARRLFETALTRVVADGEGISRTVPHWTSAVLFNGIGRYEDALAAAQEAARSRGELSTPNRARVELIEAAVRCGRAELASEPLARLCEATRASGTAWALGVEARSRALVSVGDTADRLYGEAIERLGQTRMRSELARARLLYGEWLRRDSRRVDARAQLRQAYDLFVAIGMEAFAERARRELFATGEKVRKPAVETRDDLTEQERQIAALARDGLSNPEIGSRLFLSPRTVEWHLRKVFTKLGIRSRRELWAVLPTSESELVSA